jgi:hypothetical protein
VAVARLAEVRDFHAGPGWGRIKFASFPRGQDG